MLSVLAHVFYCVCIVTLIWVIYGYSVTFTGGSSVIGGFDKLFLKGVTTDSLAATFSVGVNITELIYICFQMTFACITPALIIGAFAERMKFSAVLLFLALWVTFIYLPVAHSVWQSTGWLFKDGALDFAGGTVVHITSGVSALVCALYLGKRKGFGTEAMRPHSVVLSTIGACLLWVGWFGFNAGSALNASGLASSAFIATHFGAAAAAMTWLLAEWMVMGKPSVLGGISGAVAGLVAITPAAGFVSVGGALVIGVAAGAVCYWALRLKTRFRFDDSLDVPLPVHFLDTAIQLLGSSRAWLVYAIGGFPVDLRIDRRAGVGTYPFSLVNISHPASPRSVDGG